MTTSGATTHRIEPDGIFRGVRPAAVVLLHKDPALQVLVPQPTK